MISNLAAPLMNEVGRGPAGPDQELQPSAAFSLGADLGAADKVALRDDADQRSGFIDHRKSTDVMLQHVVCCFDDKSVGSDGYNLPRHDLMCAHLRSPGRDKDASTRGVSMAKRIYSSQRQSRQ
jgi:hypothetical protein